MQRILMMTSLLWGLVKCLKRVKDRETELTESQVDIPPLKSKVCAPPGRDPPDVGPLNGRAIVGLGHQRQRQISFRPPGSKRR
ncbi:hypothetical protein B0T11DRAFT_273153 [Plectosphaerella cucumerina]|uniref:Secreted protein n=1 Tax=Plectosphaerella cucumerina TaxID=40658 RepID=A0A8K0TUC0_9PEZI|nr:hypothetical protein B0T11DRAFT_273153 [Plectosphaerella cucumerina]